MSNGWSSRSRRSPPRPPLPALAVYALPAVVGSGRGDVEELRVAVRAVAHAGFDVRIPEGPGRPAAVRSADLAAWGGARFEPEPRRAGARALVLTSQFGAVAADARPGPYGRPGPWAATVAGIERAYGARRTVHVSLEEFARNLPAAEQELERWREGGRPVAEIRARARTVRGRREILRMRRLFRTYRELRRPNLLALFPTFAPRATFARDFPEAVEVPPLYRGPPAPRRGPAPGVRVAPSGRWLWYASPSSSGLLAPGIARGLRRAGVPTVVEVRARTEAIAAAIGGDAPFRHLPTERAASWDRRFASAELRIVTGSRSLLEALELGGPFLYQNGLAGPAGRRRPHRPEKLASLLRRWRRLGVPAELRRDLRDFAAGRRVAEVVARAAADPAWRRAFPPPSAGPDGRARLVEVVRRWAATSETAEAFVRSERARLRRPRGF